MSDESHTLGMRVDQLSEFVKQLDDDDRAELLIYLNENVESFEDYYIDHPELKKEVAAAYGDDDE